MRDASGVRWLEDLVSRDIKMGDRKVTEEHLPPSQSSVATEDS